MEKLFIKKIRTLEQRILINKKAVLSLQDESKKNCKRLYIFEEKSCKVPNKITIIVKVHNLDYIVGCRKKMHD
jgi:hypothetical protein